MKIRHVYSGYSGNNNIIGPAEEGRSALYVFFSIAHNFHYHGIPSQRRGDIIVLDIELINDRLIHATELSIVIVYRQLGESPRWYVETVLRGPLTKSSTEILDIVHAKIQSGETAIDCPYVLLPDRHNLLIIGSHKDDDFIFASIDMKLLEGWSNHLQTLEEYRAGDRTKRMVSRGV